jgi:uncharacterized membrane protein
MTSVQQDTSRTIPRTTLPGSQERKRRGRVGGGRINVGRGERIASIAAGSILAALALYRRSLPGLLAAGAGGSLLYRGASGHCHLYDALGIDTARRPGARHGEDLHDRGIHVEQAFLINKSPEELYAFWRNLENLPSILSHVKSVQVLDETRSRWVVDAPRIAGGQVEWEAEITRDEPNAFIAWRSLPGSQVDTTGQIRFTRAMGDRGTEVHVFMEYLPPAGKVGHWIATLFGSSPKTLIREDLRNFKRIQELGEIPTIRGQPRGTCKSRGMREEE